MKFIVTAKSHTPFIKKRIIGVGLVSTSMLLLITLLPAGTFAFTDQPPVPTQPATASPTTTSGTPTPAGTAAAAPSSSTSSGNTTPPASTAGSAPGLSSPISIQNPSQFETLADFVGSIPYILSAFIGVGTLFGFLLGAYMYFTSGGNEEQIEKGKTQMVGSVIALFIVLAASGIILEVSKFFSSGKL